MGDAVEVVQQGLVLQLVYFIQNDDVRGVVCGAEAVEEDVSGCGLAVNIDGFPDAIEEAVEGLEAAVVFPAVDVLVVEIDDLAAELFDEELCDTGFPCA